MCQMEFEVLGKTDNWLQLKKDGIGVKFMGMLITYSRRNLVMPIFGFFVKTLLLLRFQS